MKITKTQLRSIVRKIIKENMEMESDSSWITLKNVEDLFINGQLEEQVRNEIENAASGYEERPNPENLLDDVLSELINSDEIFYAWDSSTGGSGDRDEFEYSLDGWFRNNMDDILDIISKHLVIDTDPGDPTEAIFGSESNYWSWKNG